jgi:hypothetical protein
MWEASMSKYRVGQKVSVAGIKGEIRLIDRDGYAYVVPEKEYIRYNNFITLKGLVFTKLDPKGKDILGNKAKIYK